MDKLTEDYNEYDEILDSKESIKELIRKINKERYTYIGIRHLADDENYQIGDFCRNSYDWNYENDCSSYYTENPEELPGTCAYNTNINSSWDDGEEIKGKIITAISESDCYSGRIAIIAGKSAEYGNDQEEIIIENAEVIYLFA